MIGLSLFGNLHILHDISCHLTQDMWPNGSDCLALRRAFAVQVPQRTLSSFRSDEMLAASIPVNALEVRAS